MPAASDNVGALGGENEEPSNGADEGEDAAPQPMLLRAALVDEAALLSKLERELPTNDPSLRGEQRNDHIATALHRALQQLRSCNHPTDSEEAPITLRTCDVGLYEQNRYLLERGEISGVVASTSVHSACCHIDAMIYECI